jgi:hypothetical protein
VCWKANSCSWGLIFHVLSNKTQWFTYDKHRHGTHLNPLQSENLRLSSRGDPRVPIELI